MTNYSTLTDVLWMEGDYVFFMDPKGSHKIFLTPNCKSALSSPSTPLLL